jgi:hypothetical protein
LLLHIFPVACTTTKDFDLNWDDFVELLYSIIEIFEHVIAKFPDLLHFLDSWVVHREKRHTIGGAKHIAPSCWSLGLGINKQS